MPRRAGPGWAESILVLLPVRLGLAAIFGYAAYFKILDPQAFAFAIKAFEIFDPKHHAHILTMLAFAIPSAEMIIAVMLVMGFWTRSAASTLTVMLFAFTCGLASLMMRGIETECAFFGEREFLCSGAVGYCHLGRNAGLLLLSLLLAWRGGGRLALDRALHPECWHGSDGVDADAEHA